MDIKNTKIAIKNPEHSILVQKALFELGVEWRMSDSNSTQLIEKKYLFVDAQNSLSWLDDADVFSEHSNLEIVYNLETSEFETPKTLKHKHADLIMKFAEIAQTDTKPWQHFEYFNTLLRQWIRMGQSDVFRADYEYRFKKVNKVKVINSVEIPDITFIPENGEEFIVPALNADGCQNRVANLESRWFGYYLKKDLCYPNTEEGEAAAILHSKALLNYIGESNA